MELRGKLETFELTLLLLKAKENERFVFFRIDPMFVSNLSITGQPLEPRMDIVEITRRSEDGFNVILYPVSNEKDRTDILLFNKIKNDPDHGVYTPNDNPNGLYANSIRLKRRFLDSYSTYYGDVYSFMKGLKEQCYKKKQLKKELYFAEQSFKEDYNNIVELLSERNPSLLI